MLKIDVDPLIETLVERSRHDEESHNEGMKSQLEDALTKRHETEAKLGQAETRIAQLEEALRSGTFKNPIKRNFFCFCSRIPTFHNYLYFYFIFRSWISYKTFSSSGPSHCKAYGQAHRN